MADKRKKWLTVEDLKKGNKRINLTIPYRFCEKIATMANMKGCSPTTYLNLIVIENVTKEYKSVNQNDLPGQENLFTKQRKKK